MEQPKFANGLTKTFRKVTYIYNLIELILTIVAIPLTVAAYGIVALVLQSIPESTTPEFWQIWSYAAPISLGFLILVEIWFIVIHAVFKKYIAKPTYGQFIGLAVTSFIFGLDFFMTVFFIIIYIFESKNAKRANQEEDI